MRLSLFLSCGWLSRVRGQKGRAAVFTVDLSESSFFLKSWILLDSCDAPSSLSLSLSTLSIGSTWLSQDSFLVLLTGNRNHRSTLQ